MPENRDIECAAGQYTLLTSKDVAALRALNRGVHSVDLVATVDATEPLSRAGSVRLTPGALLLPDVTLALLWPGVPGAVRVWAFVADHIGAVTISVSHE